MIPSIQSCIDLANTDPDPDHGAGERERVPLPPEELIKLGDLRRREHIQRAQQRRDLEVAKIVADSLEGEPLDPQRPYGLPEGMSAIIVTIWEMILDYIVDLEDIVPVRDTCTLFRSLVAQKYLICRLNEVVKKVPNVFDVGTWEILPLFRLVNRSTKTAIDKLTLSDLRDLHALFWLFYPKLELAATPRWPETLSPIITSLKERPYGPNEHFPLTTISFGDYDVDEPIPGIEIGVLRTAFELLLELIGSRIRSFEFIFQEQTLDTYNRLRRWVDLMPNLQELSVNVSVEHDEEPPAPDGQIPVVLPPFPVCPMLKQFSFCLASRFNILASAVIAQILQANPAIKEVVNHYDIRTSIRGDLDRWKEAEFTTSFRSLKTFQLSRCDLIANLTIPPLHFLDSRFAWPLKRLSIVTDKKNYPNSNPAFPSRRLFAFVNSFGDTLEELSVDWKMQDSGSYLVLPKLTNLMWKLWPGWMNLEFMIALENLREFDLDLSSCPQLNDSFETVKRFIEIENNLLELFPALRILVKVWRWPGYWQSWHWRGRDVWNVLLIR